MKMLGQGFVPALFSAALLVASPQLLMADSSNPVVLDEEDEDGESGFGIPLWGNKKEPKEIAPKLSDESKQVVAEGAAEEDECIVLDDEDEDEDGVCGVPIRFPGDAKSKAKAIKEGREPYNAELYRVVIDEEDETNESGFGIPLPTEDNPDPWNGERTTPVEPEEDIWGDD